MDKKISFQNIIGEHHFDENLTLTKESEGESSKLDSGLIDVTGEQRLKILSNFKSKEFFKAFREKNIALTKEKIKASFTEDILIIQASKSIEELDKTINSHAKRLREWFSYAVPELSEETPKHEEYIQKVIEMQDIPEEFDMSVKISELHLQKIKDFAKTIQLLYEERERQEAYLQKLVGQVAPNLTAVAGSNVAAKLLSLSGSLERLSKFPAPKIQLMGAEVALFRHLQTGAKPPKHGVILEHPLVSQAKKHHKGKIARKLADKISIASKIDYFKGDFIGTQLLETLQKDVAKLDRK